MNRKPSILLVDDDKLIHSLVSVLLKGTDAEMLFAMNGQEAVDIAESQRPTLILLDINLPDISGFDICQSLAASPQTADIPVIFLTGTDDSQTKINAFKHGAVDYVVKPFNSAELKARVSSVLKTQLLISQLEIQANTDALTGLPNRKAFNAAIDYAIIRNRNNLQQQQKFAVLVLDLDRFKTINDSLGHDAGDELLKHVSEKLTHGLEQAASSHAGDNNHMVARMGGDEFMILLEPVRDQEQAVDIGQFLVQSLAEPFDYHGHDINTPVSIGVRTWDEACDSADTLMRDGDVAMYHAKSTGRNRCVGFAPVMHAKALERFQFERDLHEALRKKQFVLKYQPIVSLETADIFAFEVLTCWDTPLRGTLQPDQFMPIAEEAGLGEQIGYWTMDQACRQIRDWTQRFSEDLLPALSLNVSPKQLVSPSFIDQMHTVLVGQQVKAGSLILECSESSLMTEADNAIESLKILQQASIKLAMDHFGSGQSSLGHLHRFPLNIIKIDHTLVSNMQKNRAYAAIIHAMITLAHNLNMKVIAQGIETLEQLAQLQALECDFAQGDYFTSPVDAATAEAFIVNPPLLGAAG